MSTAKSDNKNIALSPYYQTTYIKFCRRAPTNGEQRLPPLAGLCSKAVGSDPTFTNITFRRLN